jgi:hypothetical protein
MTTKTPRRTQHYDSVAPRFKNWETPPEFFKKLNKEFGFTLDAAASHENALCPNYYTIDGGYFKTEDGPKIADLNNGLTGSWNSGTQVYVGPPYDSSIVRWVDKAFQFHRHLMEMRAQPVISSGARVFCNPPYDALISKWVDKAFQFEAEVAVLLLPPNFDTAWGQKLWAAYNQGSIEIRLPPGRLRFWRPAFKNPKSTLKDYEIYGEDIFDYSKPHVPGDAPRAGNLIAIFRR